MSNAERTAQENLPRIKVTRAELEFHYKLYCLRREALILEGHFVPRGDCDDYLDRFEIVGK